MQRVAVDGAQRSARTGRRSKRSRGVHAREQWGARYGPLARRIAGRARDPSGRVATTLAALLVLLASIFVGCRDGTGAPPTQPRTAASPTTESSVAPAAASPSSVEDRDRSFIDALVPRHEGVRELASIALTRVEHSELRPLISELVRVHGSEINQMRRWRQQWFGSGATPPMSQTPGLSAGAATAGAPTINMEAEVVRLRGAPAPFDRAFIDMMIPLYQNGIDLARLAEMHAARPELMELARTIVERQVRESDQLIRWRQDWYGDADRPARAPSGTVPSGADPSQGPRDGQDPHQGH